MWFVVEFEDGKEDEDASVFVTQWSAGGGDTNGGETVGERASVCGDWVKV